MWFTADDNLNNNDLNSILSTNSVNYFAKCTTNINILTGSDYMATSISIAFTSYSKIDK